MSSPFSIAIGGGDHRTNAAVLLITPTRISVGGELGGPSNVLPFEYKTTKIRYYKFLHFFALCFSLLYLAKERNWELLEKIN